MTKLTRASHAMIKDGVAYPEQFGVSVDNTAAENTALLPAAFTALGKYGTMNLTAGAYKGTFVVGPYGSDGQSLIGDGAATSVDADTIGGWAVVSPFYDPSDIADTIPTVERMLLTSSDRKSGGLAVYRKKSVQGNHLYFDNLLVGLATAGNYYFGYSHLYVNNCDVGIVQGNHTGGTISDLIDGDGNATSISYPEVPAGGHPANKTWENLQIRTCRIGMALEGPSNLFTKGVVEGCNIGVLCRDGQFIFNDYWFEANGATENTQPPNNPAVTQDFNGATYPSCDLVLRNDGTSGAAGLGQSTTATVNGGRIGKVDVGSGCQLLLDDNVLLVAPDLEDITIADGGSIVGNRVIADQVAMPFLCYRPTPKLVYAGRHVTCRAVPKTNRVYGAQPHGGKILVADDCCGDAAFTSARFNVFNPAGSKHFGVAGGLFPEQKHFVVDAKISGDAAPTYADIEPDPLDVVADSYFYVMYLAIKLHEDGTINPNTGSDTQQIFQSSSKISIPYPAGEWVTAAWVGASRADATKMRMTFDDLATAGEVALGGIQVVRFANRHDAAEYIASPDFYMTEA